MTSYVHRTMAQPSLRSAFNESLYADVQRNGLRSRGNRRTGKRNADKLPVILVGNAVVGAETRPTRELQGAAGLKLFEMAQDVSMGDILHKIRTRMASLIAVRVAKMGFDKPSQKLFDHLADIDTELLLDVIQYYPMSKVNLAYALAALEEASSKNLDARAYRVITECLHDEKGFVREGAAYALRAFKGTQYQNEALEALSGAIDNEVFQSVRSALIKSKDLLVQ